MKFKNCVVMALGAALVAGFALGARADLSSADLSLSGGVGLPLNPTAQLPPPGSVPVQLNGYDLGTIGGFGSFKYYGLHAARRVGERLEIGVGVAKTGDYFDAGGLLGIGPFGFSGEVGQSPALANLEKLGLALNAKYLLSRGEVPGKTRFAAGVGYNGALLGNAYAYLVAGKSLRVRRSGAPLSGHLGLRLDRFSLAAFSGSGLGSSTKASLYGGVEVPLTRSGHLAFVGELQSQNNSFRFAQTPYSAALRYRPGGGAFSAGFGVQRQGVYTGYQGALLQLGYQFGRRK